MICEKNEWSQVIELKPNQDLNKSVRNSASVHCILTGLRHFERNIKQTFDVSIELFFGIIPP